MKKLGWLVLGIWLIACTDRSGSEMDACFGEAVPADFGSCADESLEGKFCEPRYDGEWQLTDAAKEHLPQYCLDIGSILTYRNAAGEEMLFNIQEKSYISMHSLVTAGLVCADDSTKFRLVCIEHEKALLRIRSEKHHFILELLSLPDMFENTPGRVGDFLTIRREEVEGLFVGEWLSVADPRSLSFSIAPCQVFHEEMVLNGTVFRDVTSFQEGQSCANYQYFLNPHEGLVGFRRSDGILWTLTP